MVVPAAPARVTAGPNGASPNAAVEKTAPAGVAPRADDTGDVEAVEAAPGGDTDAAAAPTTGADEATVWPTAAEEAAFLAETRARGEPVAPVREAAEEVEDNPKALPKLDELVNQIPAETRELLDELFRARFVTVRKVRKADLKK